MEKTENHVVGQGKKCNCVHHKVIPILVIIYGALFLLADFGFSWTIVQWLWPILVIIGGVTLLNSRNCNCC